MSMQQNTTGVTMTMDMAKMADDYLGAWNSHNIEKILSYFTDDCIFEDFGNEKTTHGKAELKNYCNLIFADFPDFKLEKKSWFGSGDRVAYEYNIIATHSHSSNPAIPATGKRFSVPGVSLLEMRGGKIYRKNTYFNLASMMRQVGLMPAPAAK